MARATRLRTWNINAADMEATVAFYRDVLGGEVTTRHQARPGDVTRLKFGNSGLGVFDAKDGPRPGVPHHTFEMDGPADSDAMIATLRERGAEVEDFRLHGDGPGYSVYVTDPAGNRLELSYDPA